MILFHDLAATSDEQTIDWLKHIGANLRDGDRDEMIATNPLLTIGDPDPVLLLTMSVMTFEEASCRHMTLTKTMKRYPLAMVSKLAGHASIQITADRYGHLSADNLVDMVDSLAA